MLLGLVVVGRSKEEVIAFDGDWLAVHSGATPCSLQNKGRWYRWFLFCHLVWIHDSGREWKVFRGWNL